MIILEPKVASDPSQTPPATDRPPAYSDNVPFAGGSQPRSTSTHSPLPAMVSPRTDRSTSATMTPREEALIGQEYRDQCWSILTPCNSPPKWCSRQYWRAVRTETTKQKDTMVFLVSFSQLYYSQLGYSVSRKYRYICISAALYWTCSKSWLGTILFEMWCTHWLIRVCGECECL